MTLIFFIMLLTPSLKYLDTINIEFQSVNRELFEDFSNSNFSQQIKDSRRNLILMTITSINYMDLDIKVRLLQDEVYLNSLDKDLRGELKMMFAEDFRDYMKGISIFLRKRIKYVEDSSNKDGVTVFRKREGNCVGFTNLTGIFLKAAGLRHRIVKGFYLPVGVGQFEPQPHRWIEVLLPGGYSFFYDPQYQDFNSRYIALKGVKDFTKIRKFTINVKDSKKKLVN